MNLLSNLISYESEKSDQEVTLLPDLHPEEFASKIIPNWTHFPHQRIFGDIFLEGVNEAEKAGKNNVLHRIITAPPQVGKSQCFGIPFPLWYLNRYPDRSVLYISHTHSLSEDHVWRMRDIAWRNQEKLNFRVNDKNRRMGKWYTDQGGFIMAAGKGTAIPGRPGHLIVVDDLYSNEEEVYSKSQREKTLRWWETSVLSRMQKWTLIVMICTRWSTEDMIGTLIKKGLESPASEQFKQYKFPALSTEKNMGTDALGRKEIGLSVCPERFPTEFFLRKKATVSIFHFNALWQCEPESEKGQIFQNSWFQYFSEEDDWLLFHSPNKPEKRVNKWNCTFFQVTDTNMKDANKNDHHVTMTLGLTPDNDLFMYDVHRKHIEGADTLREIKQQRLKHMHGDKSYILKNFVEDNQAGTIAIQQARKLEDGFLLTPIKAEKSKRMRAIPLQEMYLNFKVYHRSGVGFLKVFEDEILAFTGEEGGVDDQVDCLAYAAIIILNRAQYGLSRSNLKDMNKGDAPKKPDLLKGPSRDDVSKLLKLS